MRSLEKTRMGNGHQTDKQTDSHVDSMTDPAQRAESVKSINKHKFELQPHLELQTRYFIRKWILQENIAVPIILRMAP